MKNNKGFVATICIYSVFIFSILLIMYIVYGINIQYNNKNYIEKQINEKINDQNTFVNVVKKLK